MPQSQTDEALGEKRSRTERSKSEMDTEGGGKASASTECQARLKKGHMMNILLTDSDEEAIVDFVKEYEELYDQTNKNIMDKTRKYLLGVRFVSSRKLSVKVCKVYKEMPEAKLDLGLS